jgi:DNA-binding response OmpR family regulator
MMARTRVLVIDDEAPIRLLCRVNLEAAGIPIVFLTARAELRDRARGIDLGGVDYVTKPFDPVELAPLVRDLLERVEQGQRDELRREKLTELRAQLARL